MNIAFTLLPKQPVEQRHLLEFAERCEAQQPELAKELRFAAAHTPLA